MSVCLISESEDIRLLLAALSAGKGIVQRWKYSVPGQLVEVLGLAEGRIQGKEHMQRLDSGPDVSVIVWISYMLF